MKVSDLKSQLDGYAQDAEVLVWYDSAPRGHVSATYFSEKETWWEERGERYEDGPAVVLVSDYESYERELLK